MRPRFESLRRLWLGAVLIMLAGAVLLVSDLGRHRASGFPRVAVFQYSSQKTLDDGVRGMLDELAARGWVDGRTMRVERFNAENDMPTASSMARELVGGRFDYVFTASTNCLQAIAKVNKEGRVKHVFGVVADPLGAGVGINPKNPYDHPRNMVGIGSLMPVGEVLALARRLNPRLQRVGLPWNPSQSNSETYTRMAREAARGMRLEILEGSIDNSAAVGEVTAALVARGSEAILMTGDLTVVLAADALVGAATRGRVPVISTVPTSVGTGVLFAMGVDYYGIGHQIGDLAARVLSGEDPNRMPIVYTVPKVLKIDRRVLPKLRGAWVFPPDVLAKAKDVSK